MTPNVDGLAWYLEGFVEADTIPRRYPVRQWPFRIGRRRDLDICLPVSWVSSLHAELYLEDGRLHVRDLGSSNGTFVNGSRVRGVAHLCDGDIVHFARSEFVVRVQGEGTEDEDPTVSANISAGSLPRRTVSGAAELRTLLHQQAVTAFFQPIVSLSAPGIVHYEALGRGALNGLPPGPLELFRIAESLGRATELSSLFRWQGLREGSRIPGAPTLFVNTHPAEMQHSALAISLEAVREAFPTQAIVVEISEGTVASPGDLRRLKRALRSLDMGVAYDDFGAGQARLLELAEVPPDYLKFDMSLIRGIQAASPGKRRLVESLVSVVREIGITCIAEGVETGAELEFCLAAGFDFAQGFHLGRPAPVGALPSRHGAPPGREPPQELDPSPTTRIDVQQVLAACGRARPAR